MNIKERVLSTVKTSYAKYGFKKDELSNIANLLVTNLTDESTDEDIAKLVESNEGYVQLMQSVYNRGVSETNKKYEGYIKPTEPTPPPHQNPPTPPATLTMEQVQKLIDEGIAKGIQPFKEREEKQRLDNLLKGHEKLKDVPEVFRGRYHLDKEEDLDEMTTRIVNDYTQLKQSLVSSGQFVEAPRKSAPGSEDDDFIKMMGESAARLSAANTK